MWDIRAQSLQTFVHFAVTVFHILKELATNGCCPFTSPVAASHQENDSVSSIPLILDS